MAKGNVKATRMELQRMKKQLKMAVRGHKLLKEKRDGLMQQFLRSVRNIGKLREEVEKELQQIYTVFIHGYSFLPPEEKENIFEKPEHKLMVDIELGNVMGVKTPSFKLEGEVKFDGFWDKGVVSLNLDIALLKLKELLQRLFELSQIEKTALMLADEIESTRRRVNALEYVLVPELQENIKFIMMKISEMERSTISMLMKVKDIIRETA
jgi:V/A-type H+-transporting ATPase subunit D